jgi:antitoxin VapB
MTTAKIFKNGSSQAVRLPKSCRFDASDVYVRKLGDIVILLPKTHPWQSLMRSLDNFSDDFMNARKQPARSQVRDEL